MTTAETDESGPVTRVALAHGERDLEVTRTTLEGWLQGALPGAADLRVHGIDRPSGTGVANETLLLDASWSSDGVEHASGLVVRAGVADNFYLDADLRTHFQMYAALADVPGVPVPKVYAYEANPAILGSPFFVMERVAGRVPPDVPPYNAGGWVTEITTGERRAMWRNAMQVMVALQQTDVTKVSFLDDPARGRSGLEQNLAYWHDFATWATAGEVFPIIDQAAAWLRANVPAAPTTGLAWGDARIGNIIFSDGTPVAVLDWDLVSLAGGETDLAWWVLMDHAGVEATGVERLPGLGNRRDAVDLWQELSGRDASDLFFHLVFAAYRLALVLIRIGRVYAATSDAPQGPEDMVHNNMSLQYLTLLLELPPQGPMTMSFEGLAADDPLVLRAR